MWYNGSVESMIFPFYLLKTIENITTKKALDESAFFHGGNMTIIRCKKYGCLNNKKGVCSANEIRNDYACKDFIGYNKAAEKQKSITRKVKGRNKALDIKVVK